MSKWEKAFSIFYLLYIAVYIPAFFYVALSGKIEDNFLLLIPFHLFGMAIGLAFLVIVIRDIYLRNFSNPNSKVTWTILILMFFPSVLAYLPLHGFKPRDK